MENKTMGAIAQTIVEQIQQTRIPNEPFLQFFKVLKTSYFLDLGNGVSFDVKGDKFKGTVAVVYDEGEDLYNLTMYKKGEPVYNINGVFFDQLADLIWNKVVWV